MKRVVERAKSVSPFREVRVTQLPYVVPGVARVLVARRRLHRAPLGLDELAERIPVSDMEEHGPCPFCAGEQVVLEHRPTRYEASGDVSWTYHVGSCVECGLRYRIPALKHDRVADLYAGDEYAGYLEGSYAKNRRRRYRATMDAFAPVFDDGASRTLLDFGCGTGLFMELAEHRGFVAFGVDMAPAAVAVARDRFGHDRVFDGGAHELAAQTDRRFDVITMWSVLAHIPDPEEQIGALFDALQPGGALLILTVNADSIQRDTFAGNWNGYTRGHLMFWSRSTVTALLRRVGFQRVEFSEFYGEGIETNRSSLTPRQISRYRNVVDRTHGGNMLRVLAHKASP